MLGYGWHSFAQKPTLDYPKNYFLFPINPQQRNYLAGGMGDLRSNHFHAGIDIKTQGREGLPVYASADGYIAEIRVQTGGYGNVIFIKHPNGYSTVYGHLQSFAEPFATYVKEERFKNKTFEISLTPSPEQFKITKGQVIGLSGNTGGSGGPHLHFEIRDIRNNVLNPLYFGFKEIIDDTPPIFQKIILKPLDLEARIAGEFASKSFVPTRKSDGTYTIGEGTISASGQFGIALLAVDKMNESANSNGLSCVELLVDGKEVYYYHLERYSEEYSHDINIHIDYPVYKQTGERLQKLYIADGNDFLPVYHASASKGKISFQDDNAHEISIKIWDAYSNLSTLKFMVQKPSQATTASVEPNKLPTQIKHNIEDNTLIINAKNLKTATSFCNLYVGSSILSVPIAYSKNNQAYYLWDLRKGIPQRISVDSIFAETMIQKVVVPQNPTTIDIGNLRATFDSQTLYDTLYVQTTTQGLQFQLGNNLIPLRNAAQLSYTVDSSVAIPDKTAVYTQERKFLGGKWQGNKISFKTDVLGKYQLLTDTIPPRAVLVSKSKDYFAFKIADNLSGIKRFKVMLNDEYILCDYDYKRALLWSVKREKQQQFIGNLSLELSDNQGNTHIYTTTIDSLSRKPTVVKQHRKTRLSKRKK